MRRFVNYGENILDKFHLDSINYLIATLDDCSFGRVTASDIRHLDTAAITQGGATQEECRRNRDAIFQALGVEQEAA